MMEHDVKVRYTIDMLVTRLNDETDEDFMSYLLDEAFHDGQLEDIIDVIIVE